MTPGISRAATLILMLVAGTLAYLLGSAVHFALSSSSYDSHDCEPSEVFRLSDRACYTPQGE